jgi:hypothetical protein
MVKSIVRALIPKRIRTPLGSAWSRVGRYRRARRILRDYARHYREARAIFRAGGNGSEPMVRSIVAVGVRVLFPRAVDNLIELPSNYLDLIGRIHDDVGRRLAKTRECLFFPPLTSEPISERTEDVLAARGKETIAVRLKYYLDIDGLEELCVSVLGEVERRVYRSYALVEKVYVYRSPVSHQRLQVSWLWHFDEHPREMLKVLIYLTNVDEGSAPFEYLCAPGRSTSVLGARTPFYGESRVREDRIKGYLRQGLVTRKVTGPRGTMILFDDNAIHRGTLAERAHRDVLVLQIRPSCFKARPYIDPRWTGSFEHRDFSPDPYVSEPIRK